MPKSCRFERSCLGLGSRWGEGGVRFERKETYLACLENLFVCLVLVAGLLDQEDEVHRRVIVLGHEYLLEVRVYFFKRHNWRFLNPCILIERPIDLVDASVYREETSLRQ